MCSVKSKVCINILKTCGFVSEYIVYFIAHISLNVKLTMLTCSSFDIMHYDEQ